MNLPLMIDKLVAGAISTAIRRELDRATHPKIAEKAGFVVGFTILLIGYGIQARAARLRRIDRRLAEVDEIDRKLDEFDEIDRKLDQVAEEVAAG